MPTKKKPAGKAKPSKVLIKKKPAKPVNDKRKTSSVNSEEQRIEYMDLGELIRAPRNPKDHDLGALHQSMKRFGYVSPILLDEGTGQLVAGHGRLDRLQQSFKDGEPPPFRIRVEEGRWLVPVVRGIRFKNAEEAEAYLIADNRHVELGGWKEDERLQMLLDLQQGSGLDGVGFDADDLDQMIADAEEGEVEEREGDGEMLDALGVTIADPVSKVKHGDVFCLLGKHYLVVADVIKEPKVWSLHLEKCSWFCPFPGPLTFCSSKLEKETVCAVQPNLYIAGHILDHVKAVYGEKSVKVA